MGRKRSKGPLFLVAALLLTAPIAAIAAQPPGNGGPWSTPTPAPISTPSHIGPSFDCAALHTPSAQLICGSPSLSRLDLKLVQAYYALRWQVGREGWPALVTEILAFQKWALATCGIPETGMLPDNVPEMRACLASRDEKQRSVWLARLSGPALQEAERPIAEHIALQRDLKTLGFLPLNSPIDGVYGSATRDAIEAWQRTEGLPVTGFLANRDALLLEFDVVATPVSPPWRTARSPQQPSETQNQPVMVDVVPLRDEHGVFVVPVQINGAITLGFIVDSGSADVEIPEDVFSTLIRTGTIVQSDLVGEETYKLANGSTQEEPRFVIRELSVGGQAFYNVLGSVGPAAGPLLLGESFLSRFAEWSLDNQQHVLKLTESLKRLRRRP